MKWQNLQPSNLELQAIPYLTLTKKHRKIHTSYVNNKSCLKILNYEKFLCVIKYGKRFFFNFRIMKKTRHNPLTQIYSKYSHGA